MSVILIMYKIFLILLIQSNDKQINREHTTMTSVSHPNIVHYYGKRENKETVRFIMELCTTDLKIVMKKRRFSDVEVAAILHQILGALHHVHQNDIVHRSIKFEFFLSVSIKYIILMVYLFQRC